MKKILSLVLLLCLIFGISIYGLESQEVVINEFSIDNSINQVPDYFTKEYQSQIQESNEIIKEYIESKVTIRGGGGNKLTLNVYEQENDYYCGPAVAQTIIKYETGILHSQSTLATNMETNSVDGTFVYKLTNELNAKVGANSFEHVGTWNTTISNDVTYSIDNNRPLAFQAHTSGLEGCDFDSIHFITGNGYTWYSAGSSGYYKAYYIDPWGDYTGSYPLGEHLIEIGALEDAIDAANGYFIRKKP